MKNMINKTHIEGVLYAHKLQKKISGETAKNPGVEFITGTIDIATDDDMLNIISVSYTYVAPNYPSGKANPNFVILNDILSGKHANVTDNGTGVKLRVDSAIGLNDFYTESNGVVELASPKRNDGGFIHIMGASDKLAEDPNARATFEVDMIITNAARKEADEERNLPEKVVLKGAIFNFRKELLPVEFTVKNSLAMDYFEGLEPSAKNPVFTRLRGRQVSQTVVRQITEEGAFGEPSVREVRSINKEFLVNWAAGEPYAWDTEETITATELTEAMANRQTYLATVKQRYDDRVKAQAAPTPKTATPAIGGFNF